MRTEAARCTGSDVFDTPDEEICARVGLDAELDDESPLGRERSVSPKRDARRRCSLLHCARLYRRGGAHVRKKPEEFA